MNVLPDIPQNGDFKFWFLIMQFQQEKSIFIIIT
jgi:hypothetical protein